MNAEVKVPFTAEQFEAALNQADAIRFNGGPLLVAWRVRHTSDGTPEYVHAWSYGAWIRGAHNIIFSKIDTMEYLPAEKVFVFSYRTDKKSYRVQLYKLSEVGLKEHEQ